MDLAGLDALTQQARRANARTVRKLVRQECSSHGRAHELAMGRLTALIAVNPAARQIAVDAGAADALAQMVVSGSQAPHRQQRALVALLNLGFDPQRQDGARAAAVADAALAAGALPAIARQLDGSRSGMQAMVLALLLPACTTREAARAAVAADPGAPALASLLSSRAAEAPDAAADAASRQALDVIEDLSHLMALIAQPGPAAGTGGCGRHPGAGRGLAPRSSQPGSARQLCRSAG